MSSQLSLKTSDPFTSESLNNGEFSVVKSRLPFIALGVDHAGEQENKLLKISRGLRGIANNKNARNRFYINVPFVNIIKKELKRIERII